MSLRLSLLAVATAAACQAGSLSSEPSGPDSSSSTQTGDTAGPAGSTQGDATGGDPTGSQDTAGSTSPAQGETGVDTSESETATSGSGDSGGTSGSGADTDASDDPLAVLDDEFDDTATLDNWFLRHEVEQTEAQFTVLDIDETTPSALTVVPTTSGWYNDYDGTFIFKTLTGDFRLETHVTAGSIADPNGGPSQPFNAAGLMVRDPDHGPNQENWITHNVGFQDFGLATETKSTVNSWSMLQTDSSPHEATLRICRLGSQFTLARRVAGGTWESMRTYVRDDLPPSLQVGIIVNGWNSTGGTPDLTQSPDIVAMFDYVRFRTLSATSDCTSDD